MLFIRSYTYIDNYYITHQLLYSCRKSYISQLKDIFTDVLNSFDLYKPKRYVYNTNYKYNYNKDNER